jgi:hypothetical protein
MPAAIRRGTPAIDGSATTTVNPFDDRHQLAHRRVWLGKAEQDPS